MSDDTTIEFTVEATPAEVFTTIVDVRAWWSGDIDGPTDQLGGEFTYRHEDAHRSVQRVTALEPERRVAWHVVEGYLDFVQDKAEWAGTDIVFEITPEDRGTHLRFTHRGLAPDLECFQACSGAWQYYIGTSLPRGNPEQTGLDDRPAAEEGMSDGTMSKPRSTTGSPHERDNFLSGRAQVDCCHR